MILMKLPEQDLEGDGLDYFDKTRDVLVAEM
jgi:hypothetical protein